MQYKVFTACFYTQIESSTAHSTVPYHNTIYAYLSHIQFLVRKTGCMWVLTSIVVPLLYHSVIPLNFATSCLHNADVALSRGALDAHFMNPHTECYSYAERTNAEG